MVDLNLFISDSSKYRFLFELKKLKFSKTKKAPENSRAFRYFIKETIKILASYDKRS